VREEASLADSIRHNVQRQKANPRTDPPSSTKAVPDKAAKALDPSTSDTEPVSKKSDGLKVPQVPSASALSSMIVNNTSGAELTSAMSKEEIKDFVQTFVEKNLDATVGEDLKEEVATDIKRIMSTNDGIIHLEDTDSPQAFHFDESESAAQTRASRRGMPPRPESGPRTSPRRFVRTPTGSSPHHGGYIYTGGPSDVGSLGEMSRAESVASQALDTILDRIDAAKATLLRDDVTVKEQLEAANLIEKLAQAAVAIKTLEKIDH
jgi:hypothetical protein